jgi:hypothetical protein
MNLDIIRDKERVAVSKQEFQTNSLSLKDSKDYRLLIPGDSPSRDRKNKRWDVRLR